jgi:hypothetical protein
VISVLCPTRNRPASVRRLIASSAATAQDEIEFVFYCDEDAPGSVPPEVRSAPWIRVVDGPRIVLSAMWNRCLEKSSGEIVMQCGDDIVFRTPGWDKVVEAAFATVPDRILFAYGSDGVHDRNFGTHGFVHRRWTEAVGYITPPYFSSDYGDTWLNDVAALIGRKRWIEIYTEHLHPVVGKAPIDATHAERLERHQRDGVEALYASMGPERQRDAGKLRALMGDDQWTSGGSDSAS